MSSQQGGSSNRWSHLGLAVLFYYLLILDIHKCMQRTHRVLEHPLRLQQNREQRILMCYSFLWTHTHQTSNKELSETKSDSCTSSRQPCLHLHLNAPQRLQPNIQLSTAGDGSLCLSFKDTSQRTKTTEDTSNSYCG